MELYTGKLAFTLGIFILIFALIPLPFLHRGSAEFMADIIAIIVASSFLGFVIWSVRRQVRMLKEKPRERTPEEPSHGTGLHQEIEQDDKDANVPITDKNCSYNKEGSARRVNNG